MSPPGFSLFNLANCSHPLSLLLEESLLLEMCVAGSQGKVLEQRMLSGITVMLPCFSHILLNSFRFCAVALPVCEFAELILPTSKISKQSVTRMA